MGGMLRPCRLRKMLLLHFSWEENVAIVIKLSPWRDRSSIIPTVEKNSKKITEKVWK